jgi:pimeloyl-ACP methyl ester carboxylesterase
MHGRFFNQTIAVVVVVVVVAVAAAWMFWPKAADRGRSRFFADQTYKFKTLRALDDVSDIGGDTGETLQTVGGLKSGDAQGWYDAWQTTGDRVVALANRSNDQISRGRALLRAHAYYRTAEFFLAPHDAKRPAIWKKNVDAFYQGLDVLGIKHQRFAVPYGKYHLNAVYYPGPLGAERRPLLMFVGGYDETMEEAYLSVGLAAYTHGYSVLIYEGPGQGSVIREQGLVFTPEWEKPNSAILDAFLQAHPKPGKIVLIGASLGGYLAPRAAAFDKRIDGVVSYDEFFDGGAISSRNVPKLAIWLKEHGYYGMLNFLSGLKSDPGKVWAQENGMWVFGASDPFALLDVFKAYTLAPVASRIDIDVLILAGEDDHFVPLGQVEEYRQSLVHARSVTSIVFDRASGGGEHCQLGAPSLWHAALFDWLSSKFGASGNGAGPTITPQSIAPVSGPPVVS